jgi:hypothetical protein
MAPMMIGIHPRDDTVMAQAGENPQLVPETVEAQLPAGLEYLDGDIPIEEDVVPSVDE